MAYALFTTAAADIFLTLIDTEAVFLPGVVLFCAVQIIYAVYLGSSRVLLLIRIALFGLCVLLLNVGGILNPANIMGVLDVSLLLVNTIYAWTPAGTKTSLLFRIGITLFLLCDAAITLRSLTSGETRYTIDLLVWIFNIPSQIAVVRSYLNNNRQNTEDSADIYTNAA